jgi:hypothetical protein
MRRRQFATCEDVLRPLALLSQNEALAAHVLWSAYAACCVRVEQAGREEQPLLEALAAHEGRVLREAQPIDEEQAGHEL